MQQALMEAKSVEQPHRLTLDSRSRLSVTGQVLVDGSVDAIVYEDDAPRGGFFARLFG